MNIFSWNYPCVCRTCDRMEIDRFALEAWQREQPLSILQLDPADRAVLRIAGRNSIFSKDNYAIDKRNNYMLIIL